MPDKIVVDGITQIRKAIKELGDIEASKEFKAAGKRISTDIVIPHAKARAAGLGRMYARAAETLKASTVAQGAAVRYGGGVAWSMGAEFGAARNQLRNTRRGTVHGWNQFKPWRGSNADAGYFLWPTIRGDADLIVETYSDSVGKLGERLFPGGMG